MSTNIYPIKQCAACNSKLNWKNNSGLCINCNPKHQRKPIRYCQCVDNCGEKLSPTNKDNVKFGHRIEATCVICSNTFYTKKQSSAATREAPLTCSKTCKNEFASRQVTKYFEDPDNREKSRQATLKSLEGVDCKAKLRKNGYVPVSGEGHHRTGVKLPQSQIDQQREKVSGDKHHLFGKTYEEVYGEEKAKKIKEARAKKMAETNSKLIENGSSKLEVEVYNKHFADQGFLHNEVVHIWTVDYLNKEKNVIVEFHGTFWHAHPSDPRFQDEKAKHPRLNKTVGDLRKQDEYRKQKLESFGYKVIILWECDYLQDPVKSIEQVFSNF